MQESFPSKLPAVGTTIFSVMSQLAATHQAINLSQGFPDFDIDPKLKALVVHHINHGNNQYAPMPGVLSLRTAIADKMQSQYQSTYDPETEITITAGGSEAIYSAIACSILAGDEVIIFEPAYDLYRPAITLHGGIVKAVALYAPTFQIDWAAVAAMVSPRTRMIIINNPNNPSTKTLSKADLEALSAIVQGTNILIISDEVYEHLVFDDAAFHSVCTFPALKQRSFITYSFGKLLHATGWKIGYCVAPAPLMKEFRKVHQFNVFSVNTPIQHAIAQYLESDIAYDSIAPFFQVKRDYLMDALTQVGFKPIRPAGTYFIIADYSAISDMEDMEFCQWLTTTHQVATIPLSAFYQEWNKQRLVRFCIAKEDSTLEQAVNNLIGLR